MLGIDIYSSQNKIMSSTISLYENLARYKRNQTEGLNEIVKQASEHPSLILDVLKFASHNKTNVAARAIWVIRKISDSAPNLLTEYKQQILNVLPEPLIWEAKAELCHIIPQLALTQEDAQIAIAFFESCQGDKSKIVRAWSLNGLYELSKSMPSLTPKVSELLKQALQSDAASIRARARNILKEKRL